MGTRNLTMVIKKEKPVVAQYGQWDGYPSGSGVTILDFLRNTNLDDFSKQLDKCRFPNDDDKLKMEIFLESIVSTNGMLNGEQADKYNKEYPFYSRNHGAGILELIRDAEEKEILLYDQSAFAADSLFCEWAYVIDLDNMKLECYEGFNKSKVDPDQRFADLPLEKGPDSEYQHVRLVKIFDINQLPTDEEFLEILEPQEEEEEA